MVLRWWRLMSHRTSDLFESESILLYFVAFGFKFHGHLAKRGMEVVTKEDIKYECERWVCWDNRVGKQSKFWWKILIVKSKIRKLVQSFVCARMKIIFCYKIWLKCIQCSNQFGQQVDVIILKRLLFFGCHIEIFYNQKKIYTVGLNIKSSIRDKQNFVNHVTSYDILFCLSVF